MCRLYGMRASHKTEVGCELIEAQNSLIRQSERDSRGLSNPHGWGIGRWTGDFVDRRREAEPASDDEDFRLDATNLEGCTILAHIRRATVGQPRTVNTHPFLFEHSMLAHNGHIPDFDQVRPKMLDLMTELHRDAVEGDTDSEHFLHYLLSVRDQNDCSMPDALELAITRVFEISKDIAPTDEVALNFLWTDEQHLVGCRLNRELWVVERESPHKCEYCGEYHMAEDAGDDYGSTVVASERLTHHEPWRQIPNGTIFWVDDGMELRQRALNLRE